MPTSAKVYNLGKGLGTIIEVNGCRVLFDAPLSHYFVPPLPSQLHSDITPSLDTLPSVRNSTVALQNEKKRNLMYVFM